MTDPLDRAVDARIAAHRPSVVPPFKAIEARKHRRDRRRGTGAAALSVLAVVAVAGGPAMLSGDRVPDRQPSRSVTAAAEPQTAPGPHTESARRACVAVAQQYEGRVAGFYPTTVADVRGYVSSRSGSDGAGVSSIAPGSLLDGWEDKSPDDRATACYIDGSFPTPGPPGRPPAERALVMAADGVEAFLVKAGPKDSITPAPLRASTTETVTLPTSQWEPGSPALFALFGGVVSVRRDGDALCVVLEPLDARTAAAPFVPVVWPKGYTATAYPLEIRDPAGRVVAREGHPLSFGGGLGPVEAGTPCMFGASDAAAVMQELPVLQPEGTGAPPVAVPLPPIEDFPSDPIPDPAPGEPEPGRTDFETCLGVPSDPAACTEDLPAPGEG